MSTRERFLERLTRELFQKKGEGLVLKGGAALRALFGEQRLTKDIDLDFANPKRTAASLHHSVAHAIQAAARGVSLRDLRVSEPGKSELSPRWKINFTDAAGEPVHVEIEVSRDARHAVPAAVRQVPYVPSAAKGVARFFVDVYDQPALIATKIAALLGREAPRDVYDLDLLMGGSRPPSMELLAWAVKRAGVGAAEPAEVLHAHLAALTWPRFQAELLDALPTEIAPRMSAAEWTAMKQRVGVYVERLLETLPK